MRKDAAVPVVLIAFLLFLILFKPFYGWWLRNFFAPNPGEGVNLDARLENEALKAEIAKLNVLSQNPTRRPGYVSAIVYSRYPFNFKNEILINKGKNDGVLVGSPVFFGAVLLGRIEKVFNDDALVQTVFDDRFQLSAGIGNSGVKALFKGGSLPKLSLIPLAPPIAEGDIVYSVSPDFPYGAPIGEVRNPAFSSDRLFREASLRFSYDLGEVKTVLVKK
ncbi:MAG: hypothetical protein HY434_01510 [Candidatus Liptonbacteria bacterium]|nr:hypothetical protein [Candidatus Liptonbacteria bacterium]